MCTIIMACGVKQGPKLYVISNRDEALDRPAEEPTVHQMGSMRILAPRDLKAGGTWVGLNEMGVFAAITNRFGLESTDHHRSRGHLIFRALEMESAEAAAATIEKLVATDYNGFHLVVAGEDGSRVVWNDGSSMHKEVLGSGYHVVTERSFGAAPSRRLNRLEERVGRLEGWSAEYRQKFRRWMREHDQEHPLEGTCIHAEDRNYGTRSSTIVELGAHRRFMHAVGAPCMAPYEDYMEELFACGEADSKRP